LAKSRTAKVLALSTGTALTTLVGIVSAAVLSRVLTQHDYATYRQTLLAYAFAAPLLTLALPQALYYFLPGEEKRKRGLLVDNLILLASMGVVFSVFLVLGGNRLLAWRFSNPELEQTLKLFAPYPLFMLPMGAIGACLVVQERVTLLTVYNVLSRLFIVGAIITTCLVWKNPIAPLLSNVVTAGVVCLVAVFLMFSVVPRDSWYPSRSSMKAMLKFSVPLGLASMLGTLTLQLDKLIVSSMCTPEEFAIYANGAIEIPLVGMITVSIATVILADMTSSCKMGDVQAALVLFRKAAVRSALILLPVMMFLLLHGKDFITLLFSEKYLHSVTPFRIYLLILPVRIVSYGSALMALGRTREILWRSIGELAINAILSIILVKRAGYLGAAIATLLTLYLWSIPFSLHQISNGFLCSKRQVLPLSRVGVVLAASIMGAAVSSIALSLSYFNWTHSQTIRFLVAGILFIVTYGLLIRATIPEAREATNVVCKKIERCRLFRGFMSRPLK
jgi:O-antigen/teichoic acid export membrane protein